MTAGYSAVNTANAMLNVLRGNSNGSTFTAPAALWVQAHTGDPGSAGTSNVSTAISARVAIAQNAASAGSQSITATVPFAAASGSDTITHLSVWSTITTGTFYYSVAATASKAVTTGDILQVSTLTLSLAPIAA